jgi:two-component system KDP operon response regulator KdpE
VSSGQRILVVDDERPIRRGLEVTLSKAGYRVETAATGAEALTAAALIPPDLVMLDLMLPDADGADVCRQLRDWLSAPILLISAVGDEADKIRALDAGADDYVTKPFSPGELLARCRALLRRTAGQAGEAVVEVGRLRIDLPRRMVTLDGAEVRLTPTEFDLLKALATVAGRPLTHHMLLRTVWGPGYADETHLLRVYMGRLRDKLEARGAPRTTIETLTGVGYRLAG